MKKIKKLFNKRSRLTYALVSMGLFFPAVVFASADAVMNLLGQVVFAWVLMPFIALLKLELWILPKIASYNNFVREPGVVVGWIAVRDLTNTFFIIILLIIAFATILRISSYGYKQLLARLLIVAILVNFSMTIVGLAIDFSQIVMLTFLNSIDKIFAGNVMTGLGLDNIFKMSENNTVESQGFAEIIPSLIMAAIMLVITVVIIAAFIGMLAMRIVKLWISIVLSPAAFVAFVFPSAKKYYSEWSLDLGKNLVTGPALLFFLWLSFTIINGIEVDTAMNLGATPNALGSFSEATATQNIAKYIIGTALLLGGLQFAAKSGAAGSSLMGKASSKINSTASAMGKRYAGGMASRAGAGIARGLTDENGVAKNRLAGAMMNNTPFWGGRLKRASMKMQGYDASRISSEREQDQRYVSDNQKVAYQESQTKDYFSGVKGDGALAKTVRGAGRAASFMTSFGGGNQDNKVRLAQNKVATGEIADVDDAKEQHKHLKRIGDQASIDKKQSDGWIESISERDSNNMIESQGERAFIQAKHAAMEENVLDEKGNVVLDDEGHPKKVATAGLKTMVKSAIADPSVDAHRLSGALTSSGAPKFNRTGVSRGLEEVLTEMETKVTDTSVVTKDGFIKIDQTGNPEVNPNDEFQKGLTMLDTMYPDRAAHLHAARAASDNERFQRGDLKLGANVYDHAPKRPSESGDDRSERLTEAKAKEDTLIAAGHDENSKEVQQHRRNVYGRYSNEEAMDALTNTTDGVDKRGADLVASHVAGTIDDEQFKKGQEKLDREEEAILASPAIVQEVDTPAAVALRVRMESFSINDQIPKQAIEAYGFDESSDKYKEASKEEIAAESIRSVTASQLDAKMTSRGVVDDGTASYKEKREEERKRMSQEPTRLRDAETRLNTNTTGKKAADRAEAQAKLRADTPRYNAEVADLKREISDAFRNINLENRPALDKIKADITATPAADTEGLEALEKKELALLKTISLQKRDKLGLKVNRRADLGESAMVRNAQDGMDYSRLFEMDITNNEQKEVFMNFAVQANQDQQRQLLQAGTPQQIKLFAQIMSSTGQKVNKAIMDNLEPSIRRDLYKLMHEMDLMKRGFSKVEARMQVSKMDDSALAKIK